MNATQAKSPAQTAPAMLPRVDVFEDATGITLLADLPGVPRDRLTLRMEGEMLQIEGEIASDLPENMQAAYTEVQLPRYRRAFTLSRELDTSRIEASLKDGVLNLRIPKVAQAQPRRIEIRAG